MSPDEAADYHTSQIRSLADAGAELNYCAHPGHFEHVLTDSGPWLGRIRGIRANASCKSHTELDESDTLDDENPEELSQQYRALQNLLPNLTVLGGCCGTDHRHVEAIARACCE